MTTEGQETPMSDHIECIIERLESGEQRLLIEHPNPAIGTAVYGPDVAQEVAMRLSTSLSVIKVRDAMRSAVANCCNALPNGAYCSPDASIDFMSRVPDEVLSVVVKLQARAEAAEAALAERVGPSDRAIPTQRQMNEAFYKDVLQAEDRMREFIDTARALLKTLPAHWHDEAVTSLGDLCDETHAVLHPHMHHPHAVEQAVKRYVRPALAAAPAIDDAVVEALKFYADKSNWTRGRWVSAHDEDDDADEPVESLICVRDEVIDRDEYLSVKIADCGDTARAALAARGTK